MMKSWIIRKIFYSKIFKEVRMKHYKAAYDHGRLDEGVENYYKEEK